MKKEKLDWKALGQFVSALLNLFTLVRDTFAKLGVGIEVIPWLLGEGKQFFVKEFLEPLGQKFLASQPAKALKSIIVDTDAFPNLPFDCASVVIHLKSGKVKLERRGDDLYVDGRKVVLYLSERQKDGRTIRGYELRDELTGKPVLNANILDALYEHPELIPDNWKGKVVFFWGTIFRDADDDLYVRCLSFRDSRWRRHYYWLDYGFSGCYPAALLAS